jgi:hypothetical protein
MTGLVIIGYLDEATADQARAAAGQLERDLVMLIHGTAVTTIAGATR